MYNDLPNIQKTSLIFHIFWPKSQYYNVVLELCIVFLVQKKVDTMVLFSHGRWWFDDEELVFQCNSIFQQNFWCKCKTLDQKILFSALQSRTMCTLPPHVDLPCCCPSPVISCKILCPSIASCSTGAIWTRLFRWLCSSRRYWAPLRSSGSSGLVRISPRSSNLSSRSRAFHMNSSSI